MQDQLKQKSKCFACWEDIKEEGEEEINASIMSQHFHQRSYFHQRCSDVFQKCAICETKTIFNQMCLNCGHTFESSFQTIVMN